MTQTRQSSKQSGTTFVGLILGLIAGLAIAVIVALYITRGPKPLVTKQTSPASEVAGTPPASNTGSAPNTRAPVTPSIGEEEFDDAQIIEVPSPSDKRDKVFKKSAPATHAPATTARPAADAANTGYYLQVGAYKTNTGAEQQRAHLALQGFESKVSQRSSGNLTYYRVRVGPFAKFDEMGRVRKRLTEAGIDAIVIRFQKPAA